MKIIGGKIPVRVHPFFWFLVGLISILQAGNIIGILIWAAVIFYSVLIHEYGHALTALAFGQQSEITLTAFGGVTKRKGGRKLKPWQDFLIVLNGPLAGFALFALALLIRQFVDAKLFPVFAGLLNVTIIANLFWTIVNLLPIFPLDGGHLLRIFFESLFGVRGIKVSLFFSFLFSGVVAGLFLYFRNLIGGAIFMLFTFEGFRAWRESLGLTEWDRDDELQEKFKEGEKAFFQRNYPRAKELFEEIRRKAKGGVIAIAATEELGRIFAEEGDFEKAYKLLYSIKKELTPESIRLLHFAAFRVGNHPESIDLGNQTYQNFPSYEVALMNALSHAALEKSVEAVGWLRLAIDEGLPNPKEVLEKPEFQKISTNPIFQELKKQYSQ